MGRVLTILKKDIKKAPRTGIVFLAVLYPVMMTGIVHVIFGSIFDPVPRVGVVDHGAATFVADMAEGPVALTRYAPTDEEVMWQAVADGNLDIGMVFPADYDERVRRGEATEVDERVSTRANLQAVLKLEAVAVESMAKLSSHMPLRIEQVKLTDRVAKSWVDRLLPLILLLTFFVAGTFLTGFAIVDESMRGTLRAMLTGPTTASEVMLAKGLFSFGIAVLASLLTLWLNGALGALSVLLVGALGLAAVMTIEIGIVIGFLSKDVNTLSGIVKGMGVVVVSAVMPFLWDGWPVWISKLNPLWYVIHPIVQVVNDDRVFADVAVDLGIGVALCVAFLFAAKLISTRQLTKLDMLG